ncbi:Oligopeptide transport ATP-binding protein OppF (TC 3.A.1.5.1) [hydrothermal vent metagenome]|uniref:Oligopeptide transport ATP-binding protein OppF (TC 3.A.1.5.1) n=1 Tax=hydrothermal vent metagenome TaxID=652676 RepID=A0A3B1DN41_9ZZZZ
MVQNLLQVKNLKTCFSTDDGIVNAVDGVSFDIPRGKTFALVGESGCGKSMTALSIMKLVPKPAGEIVDGQILLDGEDLCQMPEVAMRILRGNRISMIFQEPMTSLNPVMTIGDQIRETLEYHLRLNKKAAKISAIELLELVGIPDPEQRYSEYPHQISGGMKQRVMIAMALSGEPDLLIADEPTTALDVTIQAQILDLLRKLQKERGMAILLITHDLGIVAEMADEVAVMYAGEIVEQRDRAAFFAKPQHPYSQKLLSALPGKKKRGETLEVIRGTVPPLNRPFTNCRFVNRCDSAWALCEQSIPSWTALEMGGIRCHLQEFSERRIQLVHTPRGTQNTEGILPKERALLQISNLKVHFPIQKGFFKRVVGQVKAVDGVSLKVDSGRTVALVGESGCGKTTTGKAILQLIPQSDGEILFEDEDLSRLSNTALRLRRRDFQIIFQDPYSSLNPRMLVGDIIKEGVKALKIEIENDTDDVWLDELLAQVGLPADAKHRYPHEFSGGQRQRICIARVLAVRPKLIVCDEPTSALDVSVQAQVLNLLKELQSTYGLAYLFITHDLSVVDYFAHEVAVMYLGRIVEYGTVEAVLGEPKHPYTRALLSAVPQVDPEKKRLIIRIEGDLPSPINPPQGCFFHPRCPQVMPICHEEYPETTEINKNQKTNCFIYTGS